MKLKMFFILPIIALMAPCSSFAQETPLELPPIVSTVPNQSTVVMPRARPSIMAKYCNSTETVVDEIAASNFQENLVFVGSVSRGVGLIKIYANEKTGTWTMVASYPNGSSCIYENGMDFQHSNKEKRN